MSDRLPAIIFVPGIRPKPPPDQQAAQLWRCMVEGVRRVDAPTADQLAAAPGCFRLVPWSYHFYGMYGDMDPDRPGIERLIAQKSPTDRDEREATSLRMRLTGLAYAVGDRFPLLTNIVATRRMQTHIREAGRYFSNRHDIASVLRNLVMKEITRAWAEGRRVMLIGHSFGSILVYDTLWELTHVQNVDQRVDMLFTLGSPLGLRYVRSRLLGSDQHGAERYPASAHRWVNINAVGEVAALDRNLADSYAEMLQLGLVDSIDDHLRLVNHFRGPDGLNVHKCYGYFASADTGRVIAAWWREATAGAPLSGL